jgi:NifB/MoaA-like Fe-S oxidoreductase
VEAGAAVDTVERWSARARGERGVGWVYGSDELYLEAGRTLPPAEAYDGFPQAENGVGAVRQLQQRIAEGRDGLADLRGRRALVCTGMGMARLMPQVLETVASATCGSLECTVLENSFFGPSVTTAGLLPGAAFLGALRDRSGYDLALLPAEAVSDAGVFIDDLPFADLQAAAPMPVRLSYDFVDALGAESAA